MTSTYRIRQTRKIADAGAGFTLLEILIAVALVALLVAGVVANLDNIFQSNQGKVAGIFVNQTAKIGLIPYKIAVGNFPSTEEGLQALVKAPSGKEGRWKGPYLEQVPPDPWGNAYQYRFPGSKNVNGLRGYDIWSFGPDGVESVDDIGNWK